MNSSAAPPETEKNDRRSGDDRRHVVRRTEPERRTRSRRSSRAEVDLEMRISRDRRQSQRRGMFDRRGRLARRLDDRRRETPAAYSHEDTERIRLMLNQEQPLVACPICYQRLPVERPAAYSDTEVFEIRCVECNRTAMITRAGGRRVLILDDNDIVRDALTMVLQRAGHRVSEHRSIEDMRAAVKAHDPEVLVVDLDMPGAVTVIRELAATHPELVFLATVGKRQIGAPDPAVAVKGLGRVQLLRKPFAPPAIVTAMDRALSS